MKWFWKRNRTYVPNEDLEPSADMERLSDDLNENAHNLVEFVEQVRTLTLADGTPPRTLPGDFPLGRRGRPG